MDFAVVRTSDNIVISAGSMTSETQIRAQEEALQPGQILITGNKALPGWKWTGKDFVPPPPPPVTINDVKLEQARRLRYTDGYITRAADPTDARPIPEAVIAERQAIRDGAHRLEAMVPIPPDYRDPKYWR